MLVLTEEQDIKLMSKIRKLIHDLNNGKLEINFFGWGFDNYSSEGYQKTFKKGILKFISIEKYQDNKFFNKYAVEVVLNDKQKQRHTFHLKLDKSTNRIDER